MTHDDFVKGIEDSYKDCVSILKKKNHDYAKESDPWANFRYAEIAGVDVTDAILVRILDKLARISNIVHKGERLVLDEKVEDTVNDACNYLQILKQWLKENEKNL